MAPRSAQRRPRRSSNPFLRHEPRELRGRVRACRARRAQPRSRRDSPGRRSRRAPPARKVNCPVSLTRPSHLTPRRAPPRKGRAQFDNPDSSVQNTIYASENARFETQQTITNGGRAKVAGASRLQTPETAPSSHRPRALPRAFRAKRLGSRATRLGKHARPTSPSPSTSSRLPVPAPTSRARPEPASRPHPHPSLRRVSSSRKTNERKNRLTNRTERKTKTETDTQATANASRRPPLPPTRMRRRGRSPTHPACRRTRTRSSTWGARRWAPADSTRRSPGSTTRPRKPSPRR
jgi:hypothetical protein